MIVFAKVVLFFLTSAHASEPRIHALALITCDAGKQSLQLQAEDPMTIISGLGNFKTETRADLQNGKYYLVLKSDVERAIRDSKRVNRYFENISISLFANSSRGPSLVYEQKVLVGPDVISEPFINLNLPSFQFKLECSKQIEMFDLDKYMEETKKEIDGFGTNRDDIER